MYTTSPLLSYSVISCPLNDLLTRTRLPSAYVQMSEMDPSW